MDELMNLENLSEAEKRMILKVIKRDEELRKTQDTRVSQLKTEIHNIRMQSVLRNGDDLRKICARCHKPFGMIFNTGDICGQCKFRVCSVCRESLLSGKWLCILCYKHVQLKGLTGEWIYGRHDNDKNDKNKNTHSGADLVKASLRKSLSNGKVADDFSEPSIESYHRQKAYGATESDSGRDYQPNPNEVYTKSPPPLSLTGNISTKQREGENGTPDSKRGLAQSNSASQDELDRVGFPKDSDKKRLSSLFDSFKSSKDDADDENQVTRVSCRRRQDSDSESDSGSSVEGGESPMDVAESKAQSSSVPSVTPAMSETESATELTKDQRLSPELSSSDVKVPQSEAAESPVLEGAAADAHDQSASKPSPPLTPTEVIVAAKRKSTSEAAQPIPESPSSVTMVTPLKNQSQPLDHRPLVVRRTSSEKSDSSMSSARTASPATKMRLLDLASKRALERESFDQEESGNDSPRLRATPNGTNSPDQMNSSYKGRHELGDGSRNLGNTIDNNTSLSGDGRFDNEPITPNIQSTWQISSPSNFSHDLWNDGSLHSHYLHPRGITHNSASQLGKRETTMSDLQYSMHTHTDNVTSISNFGLVPSETIQPLHEGFTSYDENKNMMTQEINSSYLLHDQEVATDSEKDAFGSFQTDSSKLQSSIIKTKQSVQTNESSDQSSSIKRKSVHWFDEICSEILEFDSALADSQVPMNQFSQTSSNLPTVTEFHESPTLSDQANSEVAVSMDTPDPHNAQIVFDLIPISGQIKTSSAAVVLPPVIPETLIEEEEDEDYQFWGEHTSPPYSGVLLPQRLKEDLPDIPESPFEEDGDHHMIHSPLLPFEKDGDQNPFYRQLPPFEKNGDQNPFYRQFPPFEEDAGRNPFHSPLQPFENEGDQNPFYSQLSPFEEDDKNPFHSPLPSSSGMQFSEEITEYFRSISESPIKDPSQQCLFQGLLTPSSRVRLFEEYSSEIHEKLHDQEILTPILCHGDIAETSTDSEEYNGVFYDDASEVEEVGDETDISHFKFGEDCTARLELDSLNQRFTSPYVDLDSLNQRVTSPHVELDSLNQRFTSPYVELDSLNQRVTSPHVELDSLNQRVTSPHVELDSLHCSDVCSRAQASADPESCVEHQLDPFSWHDESSLTSSMEVEYHQDVVECPFEISESQYLNKEESSLEAEQLLDIYVDNYLEGIAQGFQTDVLESRVVSEQSSQCFESYERASQTQGGAEGDSRGMIQDESHSNPFHDKTSSSSMEQFSTSIFDDRSFNFQNQGHSLSGNELDDGRSLETFDECRGTNIMSEPSSDQTGFKDNPWSIEYQDLISYSSGIGTEIVSLSDLVDENMDSGHYVGTLTSENVSPNYADSNNTSGQSKEIHAAVKPEVDSNTGTYQVFEDAEPQVQRVPADEMNKLDVQVVCQEASTDKDISPIDGETTLVTTSFSVSDQHGIKIREIVKTDEVQSCSSLSDIHDVETKEIVKIEVKDHSTVSYLHEVQTKDVGKIEAVHDRSSVSELHEIQSKEIVKTDDNQTRLSVFDLQQAQTEPVKTDEDQSTKSDFESNEVQSIEFIETEVLSCSSVSELHETQSKEVVKADSLSDSDLQQVQIKDVVKTDKVQSKSGSDFNEVKSTDLSGTKVLSYSSVSEWYDVPTKEDIKTDILREAESKEIVQTDEVRIAMLDTEVQKGQSKPIVKTEKDQRTESVCESVTFEMKPSPRTESQRPLSENITSSSWTSVDIHVGVSELVLNELNPKLAKVVDGNDSQVKSRGSVRNLIAQFESVDKKDERQRSGNFSFERSVSQTKEVENTGAKIASEKIDSDIVTQGDDLSALKQPRERTEQVSSDQCTEGYDKHANDNDVLKNVQTNTRSALIKPMPTQSTYIVNAQSALLDSNAKQITLTTDTNTSDNLSDSDLTISELTVSSIISGSTDPSISPLSSDTNISPLSTEDPSGSVHLATKVPEQFSHLAFEVPEGSVPLPIKGLEGSAQLATEDPSGSEHLASEVPKGSTILPTEDPSPQTFEDSSGSPALAHEDPEGTSPWSSLLITEDPSGSACLLSHSSDTPTTAPLSCSQVRVENKNPDSVTGGTVIVDSNSEIEFQGLALTIPAKEEEILVKVSKAVRMSRASATGSSLRNTTIVSNRDTTIVSDRNPTIVSDGATTDVSVRDTTIISDKDTTVYSDRKSAVNAKSGTECQGFASAVSPRDDTTSGSEDDASIDAVEFPLYVSPQEAEELSRFSDADVMDDCRSDDNVMDDSKSEATVVDAQTNASHVVESYRSPTFQSKSEATVIDAQTNGSHVVETYRSPSFRSNRLETRSQSSQEAGDQMIDVLDMFETKSEPCNMYKKRSDAPELASTPKKHDDVIDDDELFKLAALSRPNESSPRRRSKDDIDVGKTMPAYSAASSSPSQAMVTDLSAVGLVIMDEGDPFASDIIGVREVMQMYLDQEEEMSDVLSVITERTEPESDDVSEISQGLDETVEDDDLDLEIEKIYQANLNIDSCLSGERLTRSGSAAAAIRKARKGQQRKHVQEVLKSPLLNDASDGSFPIYDIDNADQTSIVSDTIEKGSVVSDSSISAYLSEMSSVDNSNRQTPSSSVQASEDESDSKSLTAASDEQDSAWFDMSNSVDSVKEVITPRNSVNLEKGTSVSASNETLCDEELPQDDSERLESISEETPKSNNKITIETCIRETIQNQNDIIDSNPVFQSEIQKDEHYSNQTESVENDDDSDFKLNEIAQSSSPVHGSIDCSSTDSSVFASPHIISPPDLDLQAKSVTLTSPTATSPEPNSRLLDLVDDLSDISPHVKVTSDGSDDTRSHGGDSGHISGTSLDNTPEHRSSRSPRHSHLSIPSLVMTSTSAEEQAVARNEEDDDIDMVVATHRSISSLRGSYGNLHSNLADSRESLYSVYSDAGEINYGKIPVTGEILFGLDYNYKMGALEVYIKQCKDVAPVDTRRNKSDPYVKTYLLPDRTRSGKRKTKIKKHTLNPTFDEVLRYVISKSEVENRVLWVTVWNHDRFGRNDFLGEVMIALDCYKFGDSTPIWYPLQERLEAPSAAPTMVYKGDLVVSVKYVTPENIEVMGGSKKGKSLKKKGSPEKGELQVLVKEAKNLTAVRSNGASDPFCKAYLLPEKHKSSKQKTPVVKRNCNPTWNHAFLFEDISLAEMKDRSLELTLWDYDKITSNDFLGGVRLNLGTGVASGRTADWMDARGEEIAIWQSTMDRPNCWNDATIGLRATMGKSEIRK